MLRRSALTFSVTLALIGAVGATPLFASAQDDTSAIPDAQDANVKDQVDNLNSQITESQARVKELNGMISKYKDRIAQQESQATSLQNEVSLLDNRIAKILLDIEQTKTEITSLKLETQSLDLQIDEQGKRIETQKDYAADLIRRIRERDDVTPFEVLLTQPSLSAFFDRIEEEKRLERGLEDALEKVKNIKLTLEQTKKERDDKRQAAEDDQKQLKKQELGLEAERNFKSSLATETQMKQGEFERILYELHQQQQSTSDDISSLESKLKDKLDVADQSLARGDVLLNWPVDPSRGITAKFHDPTYPFRNLFQHPGVDVRASVGTLIHAAAGGYVAWNKKGRLYGNYTMIVHPGNIATVYAHQSKFLATPDTYIERGDPIGLSGGMPGQPGAGLSTGPHLHFEVRLNGIPVDPENYLPASGADEQ